MSVHQKQPNLMQQANVNLASPHVLFIDDNYADNFLNATIIKLDKIPVIPHFTENAFEGLEYLQRLRGMPEFPAYIFVDINMPLKDGFDFVEDFIREFPEYHTCTNIYVLSTSIRKYDREKVYQYDIIKDYIEKPLESLQLYTITQNNKHC